jgi:hypothetical protein
LGKKNLGLTDDDYRDNGGMPYRIFLREGRRIEGEAMLTEADINPFLTARGWLPAKADSIGVGHYPIDAKPVRPKTNFSTPDKGEGDYYLVNVAYPYTSPYGVMLPKTVEQLLVPVAVSATHVAFSSLRMDPTWMALGQAAGIAAAVAVKKNMTPREAPVEEIQQEAVRQKVRIVFYWDLPLDHPAFSAIQLLTGRGILHGFPDRTVRPDEPLTRAQAAALFMNAAKLWPSVSDWHFEDVPYSHWAFREVETLFDRGWWEALGFKPRWPSAGAYDPNRMSGFARPESRERLAPDQALKGEEWNALLRRLAPQAAALPDGVVARGAAAISLWKALP